MNDYITSIPVALPPDRYGNLTPETYDAGELAAWFESESAKINASDAVPEVKTEALERVRAIVTF